MTTKKKGPPKASLQDLYDARTTDDGRACIALAMSSWTAGRHAESRQWVKQAFLADRAIIDAKIAETIAKANERRDERDDALDVGELYDAVGSGRKLDA